MRSALVTGCAGYLGSVLVRRLLQAGVRVTGVDDLSRGTRGHLKQVFGHPDFVFIVGDIRRGDALARAAGEGADVVLHLAARHFIPECVADPAGTVELNVLGTQRVWQAAHQAGAARFVMVSTADVYRPSTQPHRETDPTEPFNIYGISKLCAEQLLRLQACSGSPRLVVARLFNVIGPGDTNPHLVPEITRQIVAGAARLELGNLWPTRDYVRVSDAAEALHRLATLADPPDTVNVGSGVGWTVGDVVRCLGEILGRSLEVVSVPERCRPVERDALVADPGLLVATTGWKPAAELRPVLEEIVVEFGASQRAASG